ncbi:MAG TPA: S8 family peptidase [Candidatus Acidoferrales bacterium]|nr:S8 family peptidase [Candidatus Acidoferrales bacterium]
MKKTGTVLVSLVLLVVLGPRAPLTPSHQAPVIIQGSIPFAGPFSVLVQSQHDLSPADVQLLETYGTVTTVAGPVAVVQISSAALAEISRLPFLIRIEKSYPLSVQLDKSVPDVGAPQVWNEVKDPFGRNVTGAGVIVGFIDTGIDTTHPDFNFPNGTTKILYVWDQTTSGRPPSGFNYGFECTSADIQARTCPEKDTFGHGTHVAGIAASSGMATGNYTGVAPGASIIFVKSGYSVCNGDSWTFDTNQILDGVNYMVKKAASLRMRLVVSLSLGGNIGAHDGTDPFELALDAFVKAGTPVVVAAGNAAEDQDHIDGQISPGQNTTFQLEFKQTTTDVAIDVWYSSQDKIYATLHAPDGTSFPVQAVPRGITTSFGQLNTTAASFADGNELYMEVNSTNPLPPNGWSVSLVANQVHSQGLWNAWTDSSTCTFPGSVFLQGNGYKIDSQDTIGIPGTATDVVTVGAYVTKTSWVGMDQNTYGRTDIPVGGIASFSSLGPTRDGRVKPDIVAPGEVIVSARSSAVPQTQSDPDRYHRVLAGTSMATPHVAGTIALMLQYAPNLQTTSILGILRQTARLDSNTGLVVDGSATWGFGKLDARTSTGFFRKILVFDGIPATINVSLRVNGSEIMQVPGGSWADIYYLKGTTVNVSFDHEIQAAVDTRYEFQNANSTGTSNPLVIISYTPQYLLTVNSPFGPTSGAGWYDANSNATVAAPEIVPAPGLLGYLGAQYVLTYWATSSQGTSSNLILMDGPKSVTASYTPTISEQIFLEIIAVSTIVVVSAVAFARRKLS